MLKEHDSKTGVNAPSSDDVLEPETFWTLIEKLLLRSSVDVQARNQHNLALSAMCRGHALPCLPRHVKGTKIDDPRVKGNKNKSDVPHKKNSNKADIGISDQGNNGTSKVNSANVNQSHETLANKTKIQNDTDTPHSTDTSNADTTPNATKAHSACFVNELDIVCVKDAKIPASERLWRYAMKHSKKQSDNTEINETDFIPKARSNEAIYHALKQRLEEALVEKERKEAIAAMKKAKKRRGTKAPRTCKSLDRHGTSQSMNAPKPEPVSTKSVPSHVKPVEKIARLPKRRCPLPGPQRLSHEIFNNAPSSLFSAEINNKTSGLDVKESSSKHEKIESSRALYDCVLKKRLCCGTQLETLNKEIVYKKHNPRSVLNREMTKKYAELKSEYLNLCFQECKLRHQMAILHAEIYMMQNKGYHKTPASIKTINLDSSSANLRPEIDTLDIHSKRRRNDSSDILLFPRLKAQKPLLGNQQKPQSEKYKERMERGGTDSETSITEEQSETPLPYIMDGFPTHGVCSIYSLSPQLAPPPKRTPIMTIEAKLSRDKSMASLSHRLPKMSTINLLKVAHKN